MSEEEIDEVELPEEEVSEEDIGIVDIDDKVVWTKSDFATEQWHKDGGFQFDVEEITDERGKTHKYLDRDQITRRSPADRGATTFIITEHDAVKNYGEEFPPVKIYVDARKVIDDLTRLNPEIKDFDYSTSEEKIFARVVLEVSNIWNNKYRKTKRLPNSQNMDERTGMSWNTIKGYLHVAEVAGLFVPANRGKAMRKPKTLTPDEKDAIKDFDDWKDQKPIADWIAGSETATQEKNQKSLWLAMQLMAVSPDELKRLAMGDNVEAVKRIGDLMEAPRFRDLRSEDNILPKSAMVDRKIKDKMFKWQLPKNLMTGTKNTQGAWAWVKFGLQGKPKVWYYKEQDSDPNEYKDYKWSLREWAISPYAPDVRGKVQKQTWINEAGKEKSAMVFTGKARNITEESIERGDENVLYNLVGVLRQFLETHGMSFGKVDETSIWAQVVNPPRHATIHLTIDQLEKMKECLTQGKEEGVLEFDDYYNYHTEKESKVKFKTKEESKAYHHDAYFYFLLSLELGFRSEEAFTIVGEETQEVEDTDKSGKSGIITWENGDMKVQIYTRKGERGKKGQKIHGGFILSDETKDLIKERMKEISEGMESKDPHAEKKFGIKKIVDNKPYKENSLIGASGRYTVVGTLDFPATLMRGDTDRRTVKPVKSARDKLMAILRNCYKVSGLKDDYFYEHTLHSLRHMFAQYWLELSDYNYSFVAKIGHWKTESVVKNVYGKDLGAKIIYQMRGFATKDPFQKLRDKKELESKAMTESEKRAVHTLGYSDEEEMKTKDLKLRETVYYDGGEYWDVRLSLERPDDESLITYYEKGTDLGFKDKSPANKKLILFKSETKEDEDTIEQKPKKQKVKKDEL